MFGGVNIFSKFQLPSSYRLWIMILWRSGGKGSLSEWPNYVAVYRTAPATPGLLKRLSVTDTYCLWQTHIVCDRHRLTLKDTNSLWQTQLFCDGHIFLWHTKKSDRQPLSVTDIGCLWQNKTVCDRHRLSVTDTTWLWLTKTVCDRHRLYDRGFLSVQRHTIFTTDILNTTKCLRISKLGIYYFHTQSKAFRIKSTVFLSQTRLKLIYTLSWIIYR